MSTVNLVIFGNGKKTIERYGDSDSAITRFEEAKHQEGVRKLIMTFTDGSVWRWDNKDKESFRSNSFDALLKNAYERSEATNTGNGKELDFVIE